MLTEEPLYLSEEVNSVRSRMDSLCQFFPPQEVHSPPHIQDGCYVSFS